MLVWEEKISQNSVAFPCVRQLYADIRIPIDKDVTFSLVRFAVEVGFAYVYTSRHPIISLSLLLFWDFILNEARYIVIMP